MKSLGNVTGNESTTEKEHLALQNEKVFAVDGTASTFGTGTLEFRPKGGAVWIALAVLSAINTAIDVRVPRECDTRVTQAGSTTINLNYWLG